MKTTKNVLSKMILLGISAIVLIFTLMLSGCDRNDCPDGGVCIVTLGSLSGTTCGSDDCRVKKHNVFTPGEEKTRKCNCDD